jgi:RNA polymerase sigma-B factor
VTSAASRRASVKQWRPLRLRGEPRTFAGHRDAFADARLAGRTSRSSAVIHDSITSPPIIGPARPLPNEALAVADYNRYHTVAPLFHDLAERDRDDPNRMRLVGRLALLHLPLARNLASRFANRGQPFDDLIQVARLGLLKAIDRFDPHRGTEFLAYAIPTITGELRRHFRDHGWDLKIPRRLQELHLQIRGAVTELSQQTGRAPTATELAGHLKVPKEEILEALQASTAYSAASLDRPAGPDPGNTATLGESLGATDPGFDAVDNHEALIPLLAALPEREKRILSLRFVHGRTQTQIAEEIGVSQMHISRLLAATLTRLRTQLLAD